MMNENEVKDELEKNPLEETEEKEELTEKTEVELLKEKIEELETSNLKLKNDTFLFSVN